MRPHLSPPACRGETRREKGLAREEADLNEKSTHDIYRCCVNKFRVRMRWGHSRIYRRTGDEK